MRGKLSSSISAQYSVRITPAGAGKTCGGIAGLIFTRDHPRRCGENFPKVSKICFDEGSPPQVRGKRRAQPLLPVTSEITPAGAGKTRTLHEKRPTPKDHPPRRCGENSLSTTYSPIDIGSPPQVRGKQEKSQNNFFRFGITPAGAGKTI